MSLGLAIKSFFKVLGNRDIANEVRIVLNQNSTPVLPPSKAGSKNTQNQKSKSSAAAAPSGAPAKSSKQRSDAVSLLALLQREARFLDFLMEPLDEFTDSDVGAVSRDVHAGCRDAIVRIFNPKPVRQEPEGQPVTVDHGADLGLISLSGNVPNKGPYQGTLLHGGWSASTIKLPEWSGKEEAALVIAAAKMEIT